MTLHTIPATELPPETQAFPRVMLFEFTDDASNLARPVARLILHDAWPNPFPDGPLRLTSGKWQGFDLPTQIGDKLTDNSPTEDGYRFHDAFHIGIMAKLGWSPVMRSLLQVKRRSDPLVDEIDDGARAVIFEESLFDFLGMSEVKDGASIEEEVDLLVASASLQNFLRRRTVRADVPAHTHIQDALLVSAVLFNDVRQNHGGYVVANLDSASAYYQPR